MKLIPTFLLVTALAAFTSGCSGNTTTTADGVSISKVDAGTFSRVLCLPEGSFVSNESHIGLVLKRGAPAVPGVYWSGAWPSETLYIEYNADISYCPKPAPAPVHPALNSVECK